MPFYYQNANNDCSHFNIYEDTFHVNLTEICMKKNLTKHSQFSSDIIMLTYTLMSSASCHDRLFRKVVLYCCFTSMVNI